MLCGHPPFRGLKETEIKAKILKGDLKFESKEWKKVSSEAISLIKKLLTRNISKRLSAGEALNSPWFEKMRNGELESELDSAIVDNLCKFSSKLALHKATLAYLAIHNTQVDELSKIKEEFDKIDENKDGVLNRDELIACLSKVYPIDEVLTRMEEIFAEVDFNGDGLINFSEFVTVTMKKKKTYPREVLKKAFEMFDLDGNGYITAEELKETIPIIYSNADQCNDLMKQVDVDGDGKISFDEFATMMEKMSDQL